MLTDSPFWQEALGIRMFLYSTIIAQIVFTWKSEFVNPIGLEMVENVSNDQKKVDVVILQLIVCSYLLAH